MHVCLKMCNDLAASLRLKKGKGKEGTFYRGHIALAGDMRYLRINIPTRLLSVSTSRTDALSLSERALKEVVESNLIFLIAPTVTNARVPETEPLSSQITWRASVKHLNLSVPRAPGTAVAEGENYMRAFAPASWVSK